MTKEITTDMDSEVGEQVSKYRNSVMSTRVLPEFLLSVNSTSITCHHLIKIAITFGCDDLVFSQNLD